MDPFLVVSPHLDDAVLSAGEVLAAWPGATVLTVLAGKPAPPVVTTFDANCRFRTSDDAVVGRWHEDDRALRSVRAVAIRAPYRDGQYPGRTGVHDLAHMIRRAATAIGAVGLMGPLGLAHPDHVLVSDAFLEAALSFDLPTWLYEDLPARVEVPETVPPRLAAVEAAGWQPHLSYVTGGAVLDRKRAAVAAYRSQLWALDDRVLYVPERVWRLER